MICHAIDVITKAVDFPNQGQVPVLACDQPLYAIAKKVQWNFPTVYGEKKLVVMFGGFHTEFAALKANFINFINFEGSQSNFSVFEAKTAIPRATSPL